MTGPAVDGLGAVLLASLALGALAWLVYARSARPRAREADTLPDRTDKERRRCGPLGDSQRWISVSHRGYPRSPAGLDAAIEDFQDAVRKRAQDRER